MGFQKRLTSKEFVVLAETNPPKGVDISDLIGNARRLKGRVDAVIVPDLDNGVMTMSALAGAVLMHQQGIESIIHVCGRDRNRMALQGDLLSAHVLGIQNLIVVPGEPVASGDHPDAKSVDDLDEIGILRAVKTLESGVDLAGFSLSGAPKFATGCVLPPFADEAGLADALVKTGEKVTTGAQFVVTPPIFDVPRFLACLNQIETLGVPIIATVFLIKSVGVARYLSVSDPGAHVSEELIQRIRKAPDREVECLKIAGEIISGLKDRVQGVKVETLGWEHKLPAILDYAGL